MKLISLNIWAGSIYEPLIKFLKSKSVDTDIFCFQEVWSNPAPAKENMEGAPPMTRPHIFSEITEVLPEHAGYFAPSIDGIEGNAIFYKSDIITIHEKGDTPIFEPKEEKINGVPAYRRTLQYIKFDRDGKDFLVSNVHGLWNGGPKTDIPERIEQSKLISGFLKTHGGPKILCGDFNLLPDTESIKILEEVVANLVKKYGVESTRSSYHNKEDKFADYVFISPDVVVKNFEVLSVEVSDHLPMVLEFE